MPVPAAGPADALLRHFTDLRDRTHGGVSSRREKEELFGKAVPLIDPYARRALDEINQGLLLGTGEVTGTGVRPQAVVADYAATGERTEAILTRLRRSPTYAANRATRSSWLSRRTRRAASRSEQPRWLKQAAASTFSSPSGSKSSKVTSGSGDAVDD